MRTQEEIVARYKARAPGDMFGFEVDEYVGAMTFETAIPLLKADADVEAMRADWKTPYADRDMLLAAMKDYMPFAFGKAHGERGLSAGRSIAHYVGWTWLMGDDALSETLDQADDYAPYGLPLLRAICAHYGWDPANLGDE